ncbi:MAG: hypothetical protein JNM17_28085 [Archangium sp.]|nr:hypothetical protein [Archangium sp.]
MTKSTRTVLIVVVALFAVGTCITGGIMVALVSFADGLGGDQKWSSTAIAERDMPAVFGCKLPVAPLQYTSRAFGFQDGFWEVIVQLPPGAAPAFLGANKLKRGTTKPIDADVDLVIRDLVPATPTLTATELEDLPPALLPDGGTWILHRSGELLEAPTGEVWIHLQAFET